MKEVKPNNVSKGSGFIFYGCGKCWIGNVVRDSQLKETDRYDIPPGICHITYIHTCKSCGSSNKFGIDTAIPVHLQKLNPNNMAKTKKTKKSPAPEKKTKYLKLEYGYNASQKNQRLNMRCSLNFKQVLNALINDTELKVPGRYWGTKSEADIINYAIGELAIKKGFIKEEDSKYI